jgi:CubicO group peptidase (beta-lactamase class C family)
MGLTTNFRRLERLDAITEEVLRAARIPGAAIAIVAHGETVFAKGYGYRDFEAKLPVTSETVYPIASTTKAMNATLLGTLIDEGRLAWDEPVQSYLPSFHLQDHAISAQVTVRDLVVMRTGLPRHDWLWIGRSISRAELVARLRYLDLSAGFRERFQYNNLTVTTAGHVAEVIAGQSWEDLVKGRILEPLGMRCTQFALPATDNVAASYHENSAREIKLTQRLATEITAPSGGAIHSTVEDMARWMLFNLNAGQTPRQALVKPHTLEEIHSRQIVVRPSDVPDLSPDVAYGMGWFVDTYNGASRLSHSGYVHDVNSEVTLLPQYGVGVVSFTNFGFPALARFLNQQAVDLITGFKSDQTVEDRLAQYEEKIKTVRQRNESVRRVANTSPSHSLSDYAGDYLHRGYGRVEIRQEGQELILRLNQLVLPLQHWHLDVWVAQDTGIFFLHLAHAFDGASRMPFHTNIDGDVAAVSIGLEPAVAPIRFEKQQV